MPSAEETTTSFPIKMMPYASIAQESFTSRDVDVLVSRLKENLRLSNLKSRSSLAQKIRATPYRLPSRSWAEPATTDGSCDLCKSRCNSGSEELVNRCFTPTHLNHHSHHPHQHYCRPYRKGGSGNGRFARIELDDSYERFQALLRKGSLIKEAVKRLQTNPEEEVESETEDEDVDVHKRTNRNSSTKTAAYSTTIVDSMDDEEDDSSNDDFLYRRKPFYYDSEDEPLPAIYQQQHQQNGLDLDL